MGRPRRCTGTESWNVPAENMLCVPGETEAGGSHITHGPAGTASPSLQALHCAPLLILTGWLQPPLLSPCGPHAGRARCHRPGRAAAAIPGTSSPIPCDIPVQISISSPSPASLGCPLSVPEAGPCLPSPGLSGSSSAPSGMPWNGRDVGRTEPGQTLRGEGPKAVGWKVLRKHGASCVCSLRRLHGNGAAATKPKNLHCVASAFRRAQPGSPAGGRVCRHPPDRLPRQDPGCPWILGWTMIAYGRRLDQCPQCCRFGDSRFYSALPCPLLVHQARAGAGR